MSSINNTPAAGLTGAPRRARVCAQQTTTCQASSGADWPQQPSKPSSAPNGMLRVECEISHSTVLKFLPHHSSRCLTMACQPSGVVGLWARGVADCGAQGCGVVPDDAFILVRTDNDPPTTHNDVVHALERGITVTGDRQLLLGSQHAKRVNCIIDAPGVAGRHARIGMCVLMSLRVDHLAFAINPLQPCSPSPTTELVPGEWDTPLVDSGSQWWGKTLLQQVGLISRQFGSRLYVTDLNSAHGTTVNGYASDGVAVRV